MKIQLKQQFHIESARHLPRLPKSHPCSRMHGHSFKVTLHLVGELNQELGWLRDFNDIKTMAKPLLNEIDHRVLNDVPGLENPTSENLAIWIYKHLIGKIPELKMVSISETPDTECSYPAED